MRLGVLDVGSNTVHLLVVDAHRGGHPTPAASVKNELRLSELLEPDGSLSRRGADRLIGVIAFARGAADRHGVEDLVAFATSAVREASNSGEVLGRVRDEAGVDLEVLTGDDEARLTFLAVRRWFGWSAGRLLVLDIGGGSLEIASGVDEEPDVAISLPLGAGRLTRDWFTADPPPPAEVRQLRKHVRTEIARRAGEVMREGHPDRAVATSKTFRSLARIAGAAPYSQGPRVERRLTHGQLAGMLPRLAHSTATERARLPGVSAGRAAQLLAGAVVADSVMEGIGLTTLVLCPWALREGVILRRLDWLAGV